MLLPYLLHHFSLAREAAIPGYETLPKCTLYQRIQEQFNIDRLQRAESRRKRICETKKRAVEEEAPETNPAPAETNPSAKKARPSNQLNKFDPIMFTPIRKRHTWKFVRPNGEIFSFPFIKRIQCPTCEI
jgi:hypothetical protein